MRGRRLHLQTAQSTEMPDVSHDRGSGLCPLGGMHILAALQGCRQAMTVPDGPIRGRLLQNAWNVGFVAVLSVVVAVTLNWQNDIAGYWINLVAVSAIDLGFVLFVLLPGHIGLRHGLPGPVLWILGVVFSTLGLFLESAG